MRIVEMKCPNCGAQIHVDADLRTGTCEYCKSQFYIETGEQNGYDFERGRMRAQAEARREAAQQIIEDRKQYEAYVAEAKNRKGISGPAIAGLILAFAGIILVTLLPPGLLSFVVLLFVTFAEVILSVSLLRMRSHLNGRRGDIFSIVVIVILTVIMYIIWI